VLYVVIMELGMRSRILSPFLTTMPPVGNGVVAPPSSGAPLLLGIGSSTDVAGGRGGE